MRFAGSTLGFSSVLFAARGSTPGTGTSASRAGGSGTTSSGGGGDISTGTGGSSTTGTGRGRLRTALSLWPPPRRGLRAPPGRAGLW